jgi:hypothetical protein
MGEVSGCDPAYLNVGIAGISFENLLNKCLSVIK